MSKNNEKILILKKWYDNYIKINEVYEAHKFLFESNSSCKALLPTWNMFDDYTDLLSKQLGDTENWLNWYAWDNNFGDKRLEAKASNWKKSRHVCNLKDLLDLIENKG